MYWTSKSPHEVGPLGDGTLTGRAAQERVITARVRYVPADSSEISPAFSGDCDFIAALRSLRADQGRAAKSPATRRPRFSEISA